MQLINCERPKNTLSSSFSSSQEQPLINFPQYLSSWTPSFSIKVIYKKNFSPQILLWLPQLKTWPSNKNGKLYHNISTSSFPSRVWIINSFFGIFIFCKNNLVTLSMSKNFMDIVGKHKIIISHWLQGCLTWYSHTITTKQYIVSNHKIWL